MRHKDNLMDYIYAEMSDEDVDEDSSRNAKAGDAENPFQQQLLKEAKEMKQRQQDKLEKSQQNSEEGRQNLEALKDQSKLIASKFAGSVFGLYQSAKVRVSTVNVGEMKDRL